MQIWLQGNSRFSLLPAVFGGVLLVAAAVIGLPFGAGVAWLGGLVALVGGLLLVGAGLMRRSARIARDGDQLLLYIRPGRATRVPLEFVEVFFLGQGTGATGTHGGGDYEQGDQETANVVVRLAERAEHLRRGEAAAPLAHWCDGYITIYGTWCEPLSMDVVNRLNGLLRDAKRESDAGAA